MSSFPTGPDYVPCHKFDPRYPWDPIIPSDEEMKADAKMEQDMILTSKSREKLARAQEKRVVALLTPRIGGTAKLTATQKPEGLPMKLHVLVDPDGKRSSISGTRRFSAPISGSRIIAEAQGGDKHAPSPASAPGSSSMPAPGMPARVLPLLACPPGAFTVTSPVHISPPMSGPIPPGASKGTTSQMTTQVPLLAKLLPGGRKLADPAPVPVQEGKHGSTTDTPHTRTTQSIAPAALSPIRGPSGDYGKLAYTPLTGLTPQLLPNPTHDQTTDPTLSFSGLPLGQGGKHAHVSNVNFLSTPAYDREFHPPVFNTANRQLAKQEKDENHKRELNLPGGHPPEWAGMIKKAERFQAAAIDLFGPEDLHSRMYSSLRAGGGSHRRVSGPKSFSYSPPEVHLSVASSVHYRGEPWAEASRDLPNTPSELRQQQWDNMAQGQVQDRRDIPLRARSVSPATPPAAPRPWNPGGEPNSLRVVYPHHPYPPRNTQETPSKTATVGSAPGGNSQSAGARASTSGTQVRRDQWGYPFAPPVPTAANHAQSPPNTVRSTSGSPPYSPPPGTSATPSTRSAVPIRHPRIPSETPSYEPPETFLRSDCSTPSYYPPSEGYTHPSPSPPPQLFGQRRTDPQSVQPPPRPGQSGPGSAGSAPAQGSGGVRVRGIASRVEGRAQARAQTQAQTGAQAQAPGHRGLEQRIGRTADNAVARSAGSRAHARRLRRVDRFAIVGRAPHRARTHRHALSLILHLCHFLSFKACSLANIDSTSPPYTRTNSKTMYCTRYHIRSSEPSPRGMRTSIQSYQTSPILQSSHSPYFHFLLSIFVLSGIVVPYSQKPGFRYALAANVLGYLSPLLPFFFFSSSTLLW